MTDVKFHCLLGETGNSGRFVKATTGGDILHISLNPLDNSRDVRLSKENAIKLRDWLNYRYPDA